MVDGPGQSFRRKQCSVGQGLLMDCCLKGKGNKDYAFQITVLMNLN